MLLLLAVSCRLAPGPAPAVADALGTVQLDGVEHVDQQPDFCGEACVEMALRRLGHDVDQDEVFALTGLDPALGRGAWAADLVRAVERLGFAPGPTWTWVTARADDELQTALEALHADLVRGVPSIVCMRFDERPDTTEHFRLVTGYDAATDEVVFDDPAVGPGRMSRARFLSLWPLKYEDERWLLVRLALDPVTIVVPPATSAPSAADLAQVVMDATARVDGFTVAVVPPFVVLGDGRSERVHAHAEHTVAWARDRLEAQLFPVPLGEVWTVWLFEGDESYRRHAWDLYADDPETPYGYASDEDRALVMNIATGGGTLVHEMVHPYVAANLEDAPPWINEGLASLFEQCDDREGRIVGLPNWRLPGLQHALAAGGLQSFRALAALSEADFYADETGTNYAQSRYVMYWLQEHGALEAFWRDVRANHEVDPTGIAALERAVGGDLAAFRAGWEPWVMALRHGG